MAIYAMAVDGPHEHPNGRLLVKVKDQARLPDRYICEVVSVIEKSSRTSAVGEEIEVSGQSLSLRWVAQAP